MTRESSNPIHSEADEPSFSFEAAEASSQDENILRRGAERMLGFATSIVALGFIATRSRRLEWGGGKGEGWDW